MILTKKSGKNRTGSNKKSVIDSTAGSEMVSPYLMSLKETTIEKSGKKINSNLQGSLNPFPRVKKKSATINIAAPAK